MNVRVIKQIYPLTLIAALTLAAPAAFGYDVIDVDHGGIVEGTVTLEGAIPEPKGFNLITFPDPQYCGRISNGQGWRLLHDFVVGSKVASSPATGMPDGSKYGISNSTF